MKDIGCGGHTRVDSSSLAGQPLDEDFWPTCHEGAGLSDASVITISRQQVTPPSLFEFVAGRLFIMVSRQNERGVTRHEKFLSSPLTTFVSLDFFLLDFSSSAGNISADAPLLFSF